MWFCWLQLSHELEHEVGDLKGRAFSIAGATHFVVQYLTYFPHGCIYSRPRPETPRHVHNIKECRERDREIVRTTLKYSHYGGDFLSYPHSPTEFPHSLCLNVRHMKTKQMKILFLHFSCELNFVYKSAHTWRVRMKESSIFLSMLLPKKHRCVNINIMKMHLSLSHDKNLPQFLTQGKNRGKSNPQ